MNSRVKYFIKQLIILSAVFILSSCIGIETVINLENNNSGDISIKYKVSKMVLNTAEIDSDNSFLPLPIEEKDFIEKADKNSNLTLLSFKKEENSEEIFINVKYAFDNIAALNTDITGSDKKNITIEKKIIKTIYNQKIYEGNSGKIDEETMQVVYDLYSNYPLKFTIIAPSNIKDTNMGIFSKKKCKVSLTLSEVLSSSEPINIRITW